MARQTARAGRNPLTITPILVDRHVAAAMMGDLAINTFETRVREGVLPKPRRIGNRVGWLVSELTAAAESLPVSDILPPPLGGAS